VLNRFPLEILTVDSRKKISSLTHIIEIYSKTFTIQKSFPASKILNIHFLLQTWLLQN
jgi:hypothetical protein